MSTTAKIPTTVYAEMTPNPHAMKFVTDRVLISEYGSSLELNSMQEAQGVSSLAEQLFQFPFVKSVFIMNNFVAVTKTDQMEWDMITMELREFIKEFMTENDEVVQKLPESSGSNAADNSATAEDPTEKVTHASPKNEKEEKIISLLNDYVRPAVESDGGAIFFHSMDENGVVTVALKGACSGCPSSTVTLKQGIESLFKEMMPGVVSSVVALEL